MKEITMFVENLENYSEWLMLEYKHSALLWENIVFTNVKDKQMKNFLSELGDVNHESITQMNNKKLIVLDPKAEKQLSSSDFNNADGIVVGGILGYDKPKGRTKKLITDKSDKKTAGIRNLGKRQMPIDIAVFVAKMIYMGEKIENVELTDQLEIKFDDEYSVVLPYAYPVVNNKVLVTPGLVEYLRHKD